MQTNSFPLIVHLAKYYPFSNHNMWSVLRYQYSLHAHVKDNIYFIVHMQMAEEEQKILTGSSARVVTFRKHHTLISSPLWYKIVQVSPNNRQHRESLRNMDNVGCAHNVWLPL